MGSIRVHEFTTLDGVIDNPSWSFEFGFDPAMGQAIAELMGGCEAILLGRNTFEMFEPAWSARSGDDDPGAPFMNETPKYVVSATVSEPGWRNSTSLGGYAPERLRAFKERVAGGIYVSGSGTLIRAMLADGLVDELHMFVYPLVLGSGPRLFAAAAASTWALAGSASYENGAVYLHYKSAAG